MFIKLIIKLKNYGAKVVKKNLYKKVFYGQYRKKKWQNEVKH
jgi:hypothetical protein